MNRIIAIFPLAFSSFWTLCSSPSFHFHPYAFDQGLPDNPCRTRDRAQLEWPLWVSPWKNPFLCIFLHFQKPRGKSQLWELFSVKSHIEPTTNTLQGSIKPNSTRLKWFISPFSVKVRTVDKACLWINLSLSCHGIVIIGASFVLRDASFHLKKMKRVLMI